MHEAYNKKNHYFLLYPIECYTVKKNWCSVGVKRGLQLVLNIEQYEYMKGPNNAVGLKLLLHNQSDVPLVQDFGINIPAGMHTFVALSVSKVSYILICFPLWQHARIRYYMFFP